MDTEVFTSTAFVLYAAIGYFAIGVLIIGTKMMGSADVMPLWVKLLLLLLTPIIAYFFALRDQ